MDTNKSNSFIVKTNNIRKKIRVGDLISFEKNNTINEKLSNFIRVKEGTRNIAGANIYLNQRWLGITDENGTVFLDTESINKKGLLKVIKAGFNDYTKPVKIRKGKNLTVKKESPNSNLR